MDKIPENSTVVVVPIDALSRLARPAPAPKQTWIGFLESEGLKMIGASIAAAIAGLWTLHLYMDETWKESSAAVVGVSRTIDEISFFCAASNTLDVTPFKRMLVAKETGRKVEGTIKMPDPADDLTAALCPKSVFDARQSLAVARTRLVKPRGVKEEIWDETWSKVGIAIDAITLGGIGPGGERLRDLENAWKALLKLAGT